MFQCDLHGEVSLQFRRELEKNVLKLARACNHVVFLKRCVANDIVPKGLRWKTSVSSRLAEEIKRKAERGMVRERLGFWKFKRHELQVSLMEKEEFLREAVMQEVWTLAMEMKEKEFQKCRLRQKKKFDFLMKEKLRYDKVHEEREKLCSSQCVVNLSSSTLTQSEMEVLGKGLNFAVAPERVPLVEIITGVEAIAGRLSTEEAEELRERVKVEVRKSRKMTRNLNSVESRAVQSLRRKKSDVVFLQADKGNSTVVMDKSEYVEKLERI